MLKSLYADGGLLDRNPSKIGGTWAWCGVDENDNRIYERSGYRFPTDICTQITNNQTELEAILQALEFLFREYPSWTGTFYSDSLISLGRVFWRTTLNNLPQDLLNRLAIVKNRLKSVGGQLTFDFSYGDADASLKLYDIKAMHVKGHPTDEQLIASSCDLKIPNRLSHMQEQGRSHVSIHNVWCDEECTRLAKHYYKVTGG